MVDKTKKLKHASQVKCGKQHQVKSQNQMEKNGGLMNEQLDKNEFKRFSFVFSSIFHLDWEKRISIPFYAM